MVLTGPFVDDRRLVFLMTKILLRRRGCSRTEGTELRSLFSLCSLTNWVGNVVGRCGKLRLFMTLTVRLRVPCRYDACE